MNRAMKKTLILMLTIFIFTVGVSAKNFMLSIDGSYMAMVDPDYKKFYGGKKYFPEGKLSLNLTGHLYVWSSFGFISTSYTWKQWSNKGIPLADLDGKSSADKVMISGGLGYYVGYIAPGNFAIKFEVGACNISNQFEETTTRIADKQIISKEVKKQSGLGFRGNFSVAYGFYKNLYTEVTVGYLYASDKVDDTRINLGGFRASLGLGLKF